MTGGAFFAQRREMKMEQSLPVLRAALCLTEEKTAGLKGRTQNVNAQHFRMIAPKWEMSYEAMS